MGRTRREFLGAGLGAGVMLTVGAGPESELTDLTLSEASEGVRTKAISPVELTKACLERIKRLNPLLNAYITVADDKQAVAQAEEAEAEIMRGQRRGPLHGIPIAIKDNVDTAGVLTTAASAFFKDHVPTKDAAVVVRLKKEGAVLLGKLNMHEFALGSTSAVSHYGAVHNPWRLDRISGGSSGGSASAVAAGLCYAAVGTDTGGSIRLPSACCGIVGFKPTYGLVSIRGIIPLCWSFDHVGPMCRTTKDAALMLSKIAGYDRLDPSSVPVTIPDYEEVLGRRRQNVRIGEVRFPEIAVSAEVDRAMAEAREVFRSLGASIVEVQLPKSPKTVENVFKAEIYAYHTSLPGFEQAPYLPSTREDIEKCSSITASQYVLARRELDVTRRTVGSVFSKTDFLITPTIPAAVLTIAESTKPFALTPDFTIPFNVFDLPAINVPCGFTSDGMPIGLQIVGPRFGEANVLALAHAYEQATEWHKRRPTL